MKKLMVTQASLRYCISGLIVSLVPRFVLYGILLFAQVPTAELGDRCIRLGVILAPILLIGFIIALTLFVIGFLKSRKENTIAYCFVVLIGGVLVHVLFWRFGFVVLQNIHALLYPKLATL